MNIEKSSLELARRLGVTSEQLDCSFRQAEKSELREISELRLGFAEEKVLSEDVAYLYWRYFSRTPAESELWVLVHDGRIIAVIGAEALAINVKGESIKAIRIGDIVVEDEYRGLGIGSWINVKLQAIFGAVILIGSNKNSINISSRVFTSLNILKTYKILLNGRGLFAKYIRCEWPLNICSRIFDSLISSRIAWRVSQKAGVGCGSCRELGIEELLTVLRTKWGKAQRGLSSTIRVERSQDFIQWRYRDNPRNRFKALGYFNGSGELCAYIVSMIKTITYESAFSYSLREGFIVDWDVLVEDASNRYLCVLFIRASQWLADKNAERVNVLATDERSTAALARAGYSLRGVDSRFFVYQTGEQGVFYQADKWVVTYADYDVLDLK